jgi:proteasome lid subunit RPN8/RPN11
MKIKTKDLYKEIFEHLQASLPKEACGVIASSKIGYEYIRCTNISDSNDNFIIDPEEFANIEDLGKEIKYIVHTHPYTDCQPSIADLDGIEFSQLPWLIMDATKNVSITNPKGKNIELEGRIFEYGKQDCYTLVVDYYQQKFNILVEDFERKSSEWWNDYSENYTELYTRAGFILEKEVKEHDLLVMALNSSYPNHYAIYVGNNKILHHAVNRLSCIEPINKGYYDSIKYILRRKELI